MCQSTFFFMKIPYGSEISGMRIIKSDNYDGFVCSAGACPMSCCLGNWQIMIDDEHIDRYTSDTGDSALNKRLAEGVDFVEQCFTQNGGKCSMLDEDGLCSIQRALGEDALCDTCRKYPRHLEEFRGVREWSLSLSCPEAARIILGNKDRLGFITEETPEPENDAEYDEFNDDFYLLLNAARDRVFDIIQSREYSFKDKAMLITAYTMGIQECIDNENFDILQPFIEGDIGLAEITEPDGTKSKRFVFELADFDTEDEEPQEEYEETAWDAEAETILDEAYEYDYPEEEDDVTCEGDETEEGFEKLQSDVEPIVADGIHVIDETKEINHDALHKNMFRVLFDLEVMSSDWQEILEDSWEAWDDDIRLSAEEEIQAEQLLMFWTYTYFCGAVYDGWVFSKAMLAVCSTWWIFEINNANEFEGGLTEAAYRFAREIEHSDENLNALEEWFMRRE